MPIAKKELTTLTAYLHACYQQSREREQALHEQLNKTKVTIQEWSIKFTNIENELQQRSDELQQAKDTIATLEVGTNITL